MRAAPALNYWTPLLLLLLLGGCAALPGQQPEPDTRLQVLRLETPAMRAYHRQQSPQQSAEALALYRRILALDDGHELAWYRVGNLLAGQGDLPAAIAAYQRVLALNPEHVDAQYNLGLVYIRHGATLLDAARDAMPMTDPEAAYRTDRFLAYLLTGLVRTVDIAVDCPCQQDATEQEQTK